jgi:hypothetical protein
MNVNYCDLCASILKEGNFYMLYVSEPRDRDFKGMEEYLEYMKRVEGAVKEICPSCKYIFDKMFELRLQRLSELTEEINLTYNLKAKLNPKDRKNGKDKK